MASFGGTFGGKSKKRADDEESFGTDSDFDRSNNDLAAALNGRSISKKASVKKVEPPKKGLPQQYNGYPGFKHSISELVDEKDKETLRRANPAGQTTSFD